MLVIIEGQRIGCTVANLSCNGGLYDPVGVVSMAVVSFLLSASIIVRCSDPPNHGRLTWIAMKVLSVVLSSVLLFAMLVGYLLMWSRDWPIPIMFTGALVVSLILALTPPVRRNIRRSMAWRGNRRSLALLVAHVLVAGSILTASCMVALELSGGPAAMDERSGCAAEAMSAGSAVYPA